MPKISMPSFLKTASHGHPNLVAPTCVSLGTNISMHGIPPCLTPMRRNSQHELYHFRPSAMRLDATIFIPPIPTVSNAQLLSTFSTFRHAIQHHSFITFLITLSSIDHRSSPDLPHPKHRSHCTQVPMWLPPPHIAVAKSAFQRKKLGKSRNSATPQHRNFATPHLLPATTTNATDVMMDCAMVYAMRNVMDSASAMRALLFLLFCGHVVTVSHSDAQMF